MTRMAMSAPDYTGFIRNRFGARVFIAFQGPDTKTRPTITNHIEYLRAKHGVNLVLYRASDHEWTGWSDEFGFFPMNIKAIDCTDSILKAFLLKIKFKEAQQEKK